MQANELNTSRSTRRNWSRYRPRNSAEVALTSIEERTRRSQLDWPPVSGGISAPSRCARYSRLPNLQGITAGPILELGGDVAEFDRSAAYRTEQFLDMLVGQRGELHGDEGRRTESRSVRVEFAGAMHAEDQHVAGRHRQQFGQQQQGVSIGPLQIVDRQDHRPIGRGVGYQPDDTAVEPVSRVGRIEVCHLRRLAEHLRELGHEISEKARQRGEISAQEI